MELNGPVSIVMAAKARNKSDMSTSYQVRIDTLTRRLWVLAEQGDLRPEASMSLVEILSSEPFVSGHASCTADGPSSSDVRLTQAYDLDSHRSLSSLFRAVLRHNELSYAERANVSRAWIAYEAAGEHRRSTNLRGATR